MSLGRVDRYDLLALIGEGSFGGVYRARHIHTGQVHALKLAREAVDPEGAARVLAEARAAASLRNPHVVGIIDGGVAATGEAFVVMELLEGVTLAQLIKKEGPLPVPRAIRIARQMLDGLAAAHANGIVHRDVKPSNVFITTASNVTGGDMVKVIDFGISKVRMNAGTANNLTLPGVAMGTPGYMAPEQLGDARSVDPRADLYAVGATLFEMLTMRTPIEADSFETWMRRLRTEPSPLLASVAPHLPAALCAVVDRALARDPDARWPSAVAMRDALDLAFAVPQDGFSATALDTPRLVLPATFPSSPAGVAQASTPPPVLPTLHPVLPTLPMAPPHQAYSQQPPPFASAPPYAPPPAKSSNGPLVPLLVGGLVVAVLLVGIIGLGALFYVTRGAGVTAAAPAVAPPEVATAGTAAAATAAAPAAPPGKPGARPAAGGPSPAATPAKPGAAPVAPTTPAPAATPDAPAKVTGNVRISPPRIVGDLRQDAFMTLAGRARPAVEQCNPDRRPLAVKVDVMIGDKKITLAQPSANTNPGDPQIARCVAQSLKDAQFAGFTPGASGIYQEAQFSWQ
jgi:eukaryotic-like serine/threonine-protein kinase